MNVEEGGMKVRIRNLLTVVAMFSVLLFGIGTAHAVLGLPDDTPAQDIVVPFICEDAPGTLDTQWAIAEVAGFFPNFADVYIFNRLSQFVKDETAEWTPFDVISDGCKVLLTRLSPTQKTALQTTVTQNGTSKTVFVGYVIYHNVFLDSDQFVSWVYFNDIPNGFNVGFNAYGAEGGVDTPVGFPIATPSDLVEGANYTAPTPTPVTASFFFPRYFFLNTNAGTFNWWIILKGGPVDNTPDQLNCSEVCNEEEQCASLTIPTPNNINIIDVKQILPPNILHDTVIEDGALSAGETSGQGGGFAVCQTMDGAVAGYGAVTALGWSYQRAATGTVISNWDAMHPMHAIRP